MVGSIPLHNLHAIEYMLKVYVKCHLLYRFSKVIRQRKAYREPIPRSFYLAIFWTELCAFSLFVFKDRSCCLLEVFSWLGGNFHFRENHYETILTKTWYPKFLAIFTVSKLQALRILICFKLLHGKNFSIFNKTASSSKVLLKK